MLSLDITVIYGKSTPLSLSIGPGIAGAASCMGLLLVVQPALNLFSPREQVGQGCISVQH